MGSTVFSALELKEVVKPFEGKELTLEQLLDIRTAVTKLYTDNGYTTSGSFLPSQQDLSNGVIRVQVVEGELERIEINGLNRVRESYVRSRLNPAGRKPVNIRRLEKALQLLQLNPLFTKVNAELKTGTAPGRNVLAVTFEEAPTVSVAYEVATRETPSVGGILNTAIFSDQNLLGFGDRFNINAGFSEGVGLYNITYALPLNARDGTLDIRYGRSNQRVIQQPFAPLDLNGKTQTFSIGFRPTDYSHSQYRSGTIIDRGVAYQPDIFVRKYTIFFC